MTDHLYHFWASHGYIVVVAFNMANYTGLTDLIGIDNLMHQQQDPHSPLYRHVNEKKVALAGHSNGGGATESSAGWLLPQLQQRYPGLTVVAAVALQPGPGLGLAKNITVPTFIVTGEKDDMCPDDSWPRQQYRSITQAPAWIAMLKGVLHGKAMDGYQYSANAASILASAELWVHGNSTAASIFLGKNYRLQHDPAFTKVERNTAAATVTAP